MATENTRPTLMAVRAHPDDECFICGGTLARYAEEGAHTILVTCTLGECGEVVDPTMAPDEVRPHLGDVRLQELKDSCEILDVGTLELLGYRDSGMAGTPDNDNPASFNQANLVEAGDRLVALVRRHHPHVLITDDETGGYGHPDHIMAHKVAVYAYEHAGDSAHRPDLGEPWQPLKLYYGAFARRAMVTLWRLLKERGLEMPWHDEEQEHSDEEPAWGAPDEVVTTEIDITPYLGRKRASLVAHHTQIAPDDWWVTMPHDIQEIALSRESFTRSRSHVEAPEHESDLFEGIEGLRRPMPAGAGVASGE